MAIFSATLQLGCALHGVVEMLVFTNSKSAYFVAKKSNGGGPEDELLDNVGFPRSSQPGPLPLSGGGSPRREVRGVRHAKEQGLRSAPFQPLAPDLTQRKLHFVMPFLPSLLPVPVPQPFFLYVGLLL